VADFFVAAYELVVEVDGGVHRTAEARARDAHRDAELGRIYGVACFASMRSSSRRDVFAAVALVRAAL
jgi:very-short-patch-repair endonuclease